MNIKKYKKLIFIILIFIVIILGLFLIVKIQDNSKFNNTTNQNNENITDNENNTNDIDNLKNLDSDNDGISDYDEIYIYESNPYSNDSDNDGFKDYDELTKGLSLTSDDTDGDGLLDNKATYKNGKIIAPIDPEPLSYNGPKNMWKKHIEVELKQTAPTYLTGYYEYDTDKKLLTKVKEIDWDKIANSKNIIEEITSLPLLKEGSSKILTFRLDNGGTVLHSQAQNDIYSYIMNEAKKNLSSEKYKIFKSAMETLKIKETLETWQKQFGYNDLFDDVFKVATNGNMRNEQLYFKDIKNHEHVIWLWCGDYLTLGTGAEIGIYKKNTSEKLSDYDLEHWDAVNFELPMTLHLYNYYNNDKIEHIFSWKPQNTQWWITGFNPNYNQPNANKEVVIGSIDFSTQKQMYKSLKEENINNLSVKDFLIFDDNNYTLWIYWYKK